MNIYNVIILDESGSMSSIYKETIQSMNEVIGGIRKTQLDYPDQHHYVSITTFEGHGVEGVTLRRDRVPIESVADFTTKDYRPGGCTPLYDAMGKTLNDLERLIYEDDRVLVTIITDGLENASTEYSGRTIKTLIDRLREKGWVIGYIGANQDAIEVARDLHISNSINFEATPEGVDELALSIVSAHKRVSKQFCIERNKRALGNYDKLFKDEENKS